MHPDSNLSEVTNDPPAPVPLPIAPGPRWEALHPRARWGMRLGATIGVAVVYVAPAAILLAAWDSAGWSVATKMFAFAAGLAGGIALAWRLANARYARTTYALDAAGLRIRRGVLWQSETLVPRSRVQHTDLNRGPLDRRFGLATLKVYTAGTKLASVAIDGLPEARAAELRDALVTDDDDSL
jgi:membrane protein YdbS with pleckstrin-like domain